MISELNESELVPPSVVPLPIEEVPPRSATRTPIQQGPITPTDKEEQHSHAPPSRSGDRSRPPSSVVPSTSTVYSRSAPTNRLHHQQQLHRLLAEERASMEAAEIAQTAGSRLTPLAAALKAKDKGGVSCPSLSSGECGGGG